MSALVPIGGSALALLEGDFEHAADFARAEKSTGTRAAYESDWKIFRVYAASRGVDHLPASPAAVCGFLAASARSGLAASTIGRRCAAIRYAHRLAGFPSPTDAEAVRATVRGIRRTLGVAPVRKSPATADLLREMLERCDGSLKGLRDAALLSIGFAGAFRRSELVALTVADLVEVPDGLRVKIRRSKTDQEAGGQEVAIPRGAKIRPVERLRIYLAAAGVTEGPIFRSVRRGGHVTPNRLTVISVAAIVKRHAEAIGLDPTKYSGHSLRSGFLTSAAESGASVFKMKETSRHRSIDMLGIYVRSANMFHDHCGAAFL